MSEQKNSLEFSATALRALGLFPFPLQDHDPMTPQAFKLPRFSGWQEKAKNASDVDLKAWEESGFNLGLSLGPSDLVVVDTDTPDTEAWASQHLPSTPWKTKTSKGWHRYYRLPEGIDPPKNNKPMPGMDIKAAGGYVLAPRSFHHAAGVHYEPEGDWSVPIDQLPLYDPAWFPEQQKRRHAQPHTPPTTSPEDRQEVVRKAKNYMERVPPSIEGPGGNADGGTKTFTDFLKVIVGFDLSIAEALEVTEEYCQRCEPPWEVKELSHKIEDAWKAAQDKPNRGHLLGEEGRPYVRGFKWREDGLSYMKVANSVGNFVWCAPPFKLLSLARDQDSASWHVVMEWHDFDLETHQLALPHSKMSGDGAELLRALADRGFNILPIQGQRQKFLTYLSAAFKSITKRERLVTKLGWHGGAFVLPSGEVVGKVEEPLRYAGEQVGLRARKPGGTPEGWQEGLAKLAIGNSFLAFAISTAFAGPLLPLVLPDGAGWATSRIFVRQRQLTLCI